MTLRKVLEILDAVLLTDRGHLEIETTVACGADLMSDVLAYSESGLLLLTGLNKTQTIRTASSNPARLTTSSFIRVIICIVFWSNRVCSCKGS